MARKQEKCPRCGSDTSKSYLPRHRAGNDATCNSIVNKHAAEADGLALFEAWGMAQVAQGAGMPARWLPTTTEGVEHTRTGNAHGGRLKTQPWYPAWLVTLFDHSELFDNRSIECTAGFTRKELEPIYASVMLRVYNSPDARAMLESIFALQGVPGVATFCIPPDMRGKKLREEGRHLIAAGNTKLAEADKIDPPNQERAETWVGL